MTGDYKEKYYRINLDWVPMAGHLDQTLQSQRRMIDILSKSKQTEPIKLLMLSVASSIEQTEKLLAWTKKMLQGVAEDYTAGILKDGAEIRNTIKWQSNLISDMIDK